MEGTVSIFDGCGTDEQFRYCTLLEVSANDGLPSKLCQLCMEHMKIAYDFRFQAKYAENFLSNVLKNELHTEAEQNNVIVIEDLNENMQELGKFLSHRVAEKFEPVLIETTIDKDNRSAVSPEKHNSLQSDTSDDHFSNGFICINDNENGDIFEENVLSVGENQKLVCNNSFLTVFPEIPANVEMKTDYNDSTATFLSSCTENFIDLPIDGQKLSIEINNLTTSEIAEENVVSDNINPSLPNTAIANKNIKKSRQKNSRLYVRSKVKNSYRKENREKIECNICGTIFTHINSLKQHLMKHSGEKPFKCEFCEKCFARKTILTIHRRLHTGDRPYRCDECIRTFVTKEALNRHKERDHDEGVEANFSKNKITFICSICHKARCSKYSLAAHMRTHFGAIEELDSSKICNKATKIEQQSKAKITEPHQNCLINDVESKSLSTFKYCKICQQGFASKWELVGHQEIHRTTKLFECYVCQHSFNKKYMLLCHLQNHKDSEILIKECIQNPVSAHVQTDLREESNNENIEVDEDDVPLVQRRRKHKLCSKNISTTVAISKNDYVKHCELKCQMCKKTFSHSTLLQMHVIKHLGDRNFQCEHCNKSFGRKNVLDMHRWLHTSEKTFQCPLCKTSCITKKALLSHLSKLHQEASEKNHLGNNKEKLLDFIKEKTSN